MLCCAGLIGGTLVGQALGGPWTFIGPAAGFGLGLLGDMKMMKGFHKKADPQQGDAALRAKADANSPAAAPAAQSGAGCCAIASGLSRMLGSKDKKDPSQMTLAEIRKTYETEPSEPPARGESAIK
jgi:hypothetical protein